MKRLPFTDPEVLEALEIDPSFGPVTRALLEAVDCRAAFIVAAMTPQTDPSTREIARCAMADATEWLRLSLEAYGSEL